MPPAAAALDNAEDAVVGVAVLGLGCMKQGGCWKIKGRLLCLLLLIVIILLHEVADEDDVVRRRWGRRRRVLGRCIALAMQCLSLMEGHQDFPILELCAVLHREEGGGLVSVAMKCMRNGGQAITLDSFPDTKR